MTTLLRRLIWCLLLLTLDGCSLPNARSPQNTPKNVNKINLQQANLTASLISVDFVNALVQLEGYHPSSTTLRFKNLPVAANKFNLVLHDTMQDAGYNIQYTADSFGLNQVSYNVTQEIDPATGEKYTYVVAIGEIQLRRGYAPTGNGSIKPATSFFVKGADASSIQPNDLIFE